MEFHIHVRTAEVSEESEGSDLEGKKRKGEKTPTPYLPSLPAGLAMAFIAGKSPLYQGETEPEVLGWFALAVFCCSMVPSLSRPSRPHQPVALL